MVIPLDQTTDNDDLFTVNNSNTTPTNPTSRGCTDYGELVK